MRASVEAQTQTILVIDDNPANLAVMTDYTPTPARCPILLVTNTIRQF